MKKRPCVRRTVASAVVNYRGKLRPVVAVLDTRAGTIVVRPHGCRKTKTYALADLWQWGAQLSLL